VQVHAIHGVLTDWRPDRWADRLYVPFASFTRWLDSRPVPYRPLDTLEPGQVALTVDDATNAGAAACLAARERGHDVTLFVNPHQIISGQPYFFTLMNLGLDAVVARDRRRDASVSHRDIRYQDLRTAARRRLRGCDVADIDLELSALFDEWGVRRPPVPEQHLPLTLDTLQRLSAAGVTIGNHGWSHRDIAEMDERAVEADIADTRLWLAQQTTQSILHYAVPYGFATPPASARRLVPGFCLLLDATQGAGQLPDNLINRLDITPLVVATDDTRTPPDRKTPGISLKSLVLTGLVVLLATAIILGPHLVFLGRLLHSSQQSACCRRLCFRPPFRAQV